MSQTFDPEQPERASSAQSEPGFPAHGQGYPYGYPAQQGYPAVPAHPGGPGYPGGPRYGGGPGSSSVPPMPPRRNHKRGLIVTGAVALAAGAALGGLIGSMNHGGAGAAAAPGHHPA